MRDDGERLVRAASPRAKNAARHARLIAQSTAAMPAYAFEALDANGKTRKGVIEADTAKAARGLLRAQALVPHGGASRWVRDGAQSGRGSTSRCCAAACSTPPRWPSGPGRWPDWWRRACRWNAR